MQVLTYHPDYDLEDCDITMYRHAILGAESYAVFLNLDLRTTYLIGSC